MKVCCRNMWGAISKGDISIACVIVKTFSGHEDCTNLMMDIGKDKQSKIDFCPFCGRKIDIEFEEADE